MALTEGLDVPNQPDNSPGSDAAEVGAWVIKANPKIYPIADLRARWQSHHRVERCPQPAFSGDAKLAISFTCGSAETAQRSSPEFGALGTASRSLGPSRARRDWPHNDTS